MRVKKKSVSSSTAQALKAASAASDEESGAEPPAFVQLYKLDSIDFGKRMAVEKELDRRWKDCGDDDSNDALCRSLFPNAVFDESGTLLLYPSLLGIKVVNLETNQVCRILGKVENTQRFLRIALYQGAAARKRAGGGERTKSRE